ncbi:unnamed protein product [Pleuronectes platessa]|uniref:Uncharacterized protein n=1 Tax=Pleuronectes platessa TaxID=8262 RepID=A0A9N7TMJ9_PLEPL|nr:unnamed protein product [Pleuronectes platessa]
MWSGEAHGLLDRLTIPKRSMVANSSFAVANFTVSRRRERAKTGVPAVGMKCSTPCLVTAAENAGVVSEGNSASKRWKTSFDAAKLACVNGPGPPMEKSLDVQKPRRGIVLPKLRQFNVRRGAGRSRKLRGHGRCGDTVHGRRGRKYVFPR